MKTTRRAEVFGRVAAIVMGIVFLAMIAKLTIDGPDSALTVRRERPTLRDTLTDGRSVRRSIGRI